MKGLQLNRLP